MKKLIETARQIIHTEVSPEDKWDSVALFLSEVANNNPARVILESYIHNWIALDESVVTSFPGMWAQGEREFEKDFTKKFQSKMDWVLLPGGTYTAGSPEDEWGRFKDEEQKEKTVEAFKINRYLVTQKDYQEVTGTNPSNFKGERLPVESVSFFDVCIYFNMLAEQNGNPYPYYFLLEGEDEPKPLTKLPENPYNKIQTIFLDEDANAEKLPTEWEWEYACRAGTTTSTYNGDLTGDTEKDYKILDPIAHFYGNTPSRQTQKVGLKLPNPWGLYDTLGNVWEWTSSTYNT